MKNYLSIFIAMMLLSFGLISTGLAHQYNKSLGVSYVTIEGKVLSVDTAKNSFVLECDRLGTKEKLFTSSNRISSLHAGDFIKVTLPKGSSIVQKIVKR